MRFRHLLLTLIWGILPVLAFAQTNPYTYTFDYGCWGTINVYIDDEITVYHQYEIPYYSKLKSLIWSTYGNGGSYTITNSSESSCTIKGKAIMNGAQLWCLMKYGESSSYRAYYNVNVISRGTTSVSATPGASTVLVGTKIKLSASPSDAKIYYTLDGSTPTANSTAYTSDGVTINNSCTLKAIAIKSGYERNVFTANYTATNTFSEKTVEGTSMSFKITDVNAKTCEVASSAISRSTSGNITIPEVANNYRVTSIGTKAFLNCINLTSIEIPNSITSIGDYAFGFCTKLTSITMPNSVTSIGICAFDGCANLEDVTLSTSLKRLERGTFLHCSNLKSISGVKGIEYIEPTAFDLDTPWEQGLPDGFNFLGKVLYTYKGVIPDNTTINIPEGCTQICSQTAFAGQFGLSEVTIPRSLVNITETAFQNCPNLQKIIVDPDNPKYDSRNSCNAIIDKTNSCLVVGCNASTIPNDVHSIGTAAFLGNLTRDDIVISNQIESIGQYAFGNCRSVKSILIGKSLREIGAYAFAQLPHLKEIAVSTSNPYFDSRDNCNAIIEKATNSLLVGCSKTTIPNSVKTIGSYAFYGNGDEDFTSLVIPNSVEEIKSYAFGSLPYLREVSIGTNVKTFGNYMFYKCNNLDAIESLNGFPDDIDEKVFDSGSEDFSIYDNVTLYVPAGCRNNYRLATGWSNFKNIVEGSLFVGVDDVLTPQPKEEVIYSPTGVRLSAPQRGVNIVNGKKLLVK